MLEDGACYHCGEPVPPNTDFSVTIEGEPRAMCCPGCAAVAQLIASGGFSSFYRERTAFSQKPQESGPADVEQFALYDDEPLRDTYCYPVDNGLTCARLLVEGISCAACTWLIERVMAHQSGVERAQVNFNERRVDIWFDPQQVKPSALFFALHGVGYEPRPYTQAARQTQMKTERRDALKRLGVAGLGMMQVGMFGIALHAGDIQGIEAEYQQLLRWASALVTTFVVAYSSRTFFASAWRHLRAGALVMDLPVALAIGIAYLASLWATLTQSGQVYFDSIVMFTFFLLLGRYVEQEARRRFRSPLNDVEALLPDGVKVWESERWVARPRLALTGGEIVAIGSGDIVPSDAQVLTGEAVVREDAFTGEPHPRTVPVGEVLYGGTVLTAGHVEARVLGPAHQTRLAMLLRSVDQGEGARPALVTLADRIAAHFVAAVLIAAALTFVVWLQIDAQRALWVTLSVLVISCPCALALAAPTALSSAAAYLRQRGVLVNSENALEALSSCTQVVFDKTGTLTTGNMSLIDIRRCSDVDEQHLLALAAGLQQHSQHPVANAFRDVEQAQTFRSATVTVSQGVEARDDGRVYRMGARAFCAEIAPSLSSPPKRPLYWVALCRDDEPLAWLGFDDAVRDESAAVLDFFRDAQLPVHLLTGDASAQVESVAAALRVSQVEKGVSPEEKMAYIQAMQAESQRVCMIGDGLNDAPVLATADVSFAVPSATALAKTQAAFVVMDGDLRKIPQTWTLAKRTRRLLRQNLVWALCYNTTAIPLAALGLVAPWMAALGMSASSLFVVLNALRLTR